MANPSNLTERRIERLDYDPEGASRQIHWDDSLPGFGVRAYPSGKKSYVLHYGERHNRRLMTIGKVGVLTLAQARDKAREFAVQVSQGEDPLSERNKERERRSEALSVKELVEEFLAFHQARWSKKHYQESSRRLHKHLIPALGSTRAVEVNKAQVNRLHASITDGGSPVEANRLRTILHTMFEWGEEFGHLPEGHRNPARRRKGSKIGRNPEGSRSRYMTREEAPGLLRAVDSTGIPEDGVIVRLWLLTGLRKSELLHRRWSDINLKNSTLTVPKTKNGKEHTIPLSDRALALLGTLPRPIRGDAPLFPGSDPNVPVKDFKRRWARIQKLSGLDDLTIHDLRRTVATWLASLAGTPITTVSALLNHKPPGIGVTAVYTRPMEESLRGAVKALDDLLDSVDPNIEERETSHA